MKIFKQWCIENKQYELLKLYENANNEISSDKIGFSSHKKVKWKCKNGHTWEAVIRDRVKAIKNNPEKETCPFCNKQKVYSEYNLFTEFPYFAKQWNYKENGTLTPLNVSPKTNKNVWWICEYDPKHTWQDRISNRTILKRQCPMCSKIFKISFPARVIFYYIKKYFCDCEIEYKISNKYTADLYIPSYKIIIEYDGWFYHSSKESQDREKIKDDFFIKNGYDVIHIKEKREKIEDIQFLNNTLIYHLKEGYKNLDDMLKYFIKILENKTNNNINIDINMERDFEQIENLFYCVKKSNSLAVKKPEFAKEWSKNNDYSADCISTSNNYKAKWICPKCKQEYSCRVNNRVNHGSGCPHCKKERKKTNGSI